MNNLTINPIGCFKNKNGVFRIELKKEYAAALTGLEGFGYIQVVWWFDKCSTSSRNNLTEDNPYKKGPKTLGVFATRSPQRPNPIAISTLFVTNIDVAKGVIDLAYTDADDETPILDIKPYTPSIDRVENPIVPDWCSNWPKCYEDSGEFNWDEEFNF